MLCLTSLSLSFAAEEKKEAVLFPKESFQVNLPGEADSQKKYFDQASVKKIQESLKVVGYDPGEIFGLIEEKTSAAMRKFRADFEIVSDTLFSDHLITTLFHYAEVARVHPDWKDITLSKSFTDWINKQPSKEQVRISKLRRSGTAQQIVTLLNDYKKDQSEEKKKDEQEDVQAPKASAQAEPPLDRKAEPTKKSDLKKKTDDLPKGVENPEKASTDVLETAPVPEVTVIKQAAALKEAPAVKPVANTIVKSTAAEGLQEKTVPSEAAKTETAVGTIAEHDAKKEETPAPADSATPEGDAPACASAEKAVSFKVILELAKACKDFDASKAVIWEDDDCACLVDFSGKTVYGFYPFWLAGDPQKIDFSQLSRIAYYGLSFDGEGEMSPLLHWHPRAAEFVTEAQRYRTKVDLVIYKNDWDAWFRLLKQAPRVVIDKTTTNIVQAVHAKMPDTLENRLRALVSSEETTTLGDGVTLFFDAYPQDAAAIAYFEFFVKTLHQKLRAANANYKLNLMLPRNAIGKGIYAFENLVTFLNNEETDADDEVDLFLVLLDEPTSRNKKALRSSFEEDDTFRGNQRRNILRKIVPVIPPLGEASEDVVPFEHDLIYFEDNFGGVGFWPLPLASDKSAEKIKRIVKEVFVKKANMGFFERMVPEEAFYCKFVCPNRWYVRLAYTVLLFLLAGYAVLALRYVVLRNFFKQYKIYFLGTLALQVLIFYSAVMCDPYLYDKKDEFIVAPFIVLGLYWFWHTYMNMKKNEYP